MAGSSAAVLGTFLAGKELVLELTLVLTLVVVLTLGVRYGRTFGVDERIVARVGAITVVRDSSGERKAELI